MMERTLAAMTEAGATECFLEVRVSNDPAIAMYQSLGFEKVKTLKRYYSDNESAFLMAVRL